MNAKEYISRRSVVKALTLSAATIPLTNEFLKEDGVIKTEYGQFFRSYEAHTNLIQPRDVPSQSTFLFHEYMYAAQLMNSPAEEFVQLRRGLFDAGGNELPLFSQEMKSYLGQQTTYMAFGDIVIPESRRNESGNVILAELLGGFGIAAATFAHSALIKENKQDFISKHPVLKKLAYATAFWLASPALGGEINSLSGFAPTEQIKESINTLDGYQSLFHKEFPSIYLRNLVMGAKLLGLSRYCNEVYGFKPFTTYRVGLAHSGLEVLLQMGPSYLYHALEATDSALLKDTVELNGGIDSFCSTRIIGLDPKTPLFSNGEPHIVFDEQIIDQQMRGLISSKMK